MKNSTINKLIYFFIILLSALILFLSYKIITRPHPIYGSLEESSTMPLDMEQDVAEIPDTPESSSATEESSSQLQGKTSTTVNIRELPSTDARVLKKVEKDYTFTIIEILDNGWTKIEYEGSEAYISSDYVIIIQGDKQ